MSEKKFNPAVADHARKLIGEFFRDRRIELNISQADLCIMSNTKQASISKFENGKANITINTFLALCGCLRIKPNFETAAINEVPGFGKIDLN